MRSKSFFKAETKDGRSVERRASLIVDQYSLLVVDMAHMIDPETSLHRACRSRNPTVEGIRRLIDEDPTALTKQDSDGYTPLNLACQYVSVEEAQLQSSTFC
jgi:hypothetical protein